MRTAVEALTHYWETGDASHLGPAVWVETQRMLDMAFKVEHASVGTSGAQFVGTMAGLAFARREFWYDQPYLSNKDRQS